MDVQCEGCAGCCLDWRPLAAEVLDHERRGPREPLDDTYNLAPLRRDEIRAFVEAGLADALVPRLWAGAGDGITVGGIDLAPIRGSARQSRHWILWAAATRLSRRWLRPWRERDTPPTPGRE